MLMSMSTVVVMVCSIMLPLEEMIVELVKLTWLTQKDLEMCIQPF